MKKLTFFITATLAMSVLLSGYMTWNYVDPVNTCAQCHEVSPSHESWLQSAHADVRCIDCHGTAFSRGLHSLKEKSGMVLAHWFDEKQNIDIRLTEEQMLDVVLRCAECHRAEHAGWLESGHALTYGEVFMNGEHNREEKPYADCLRCHGMFYEGDIHTLMSLEGEPDDWHIYDKKQAERPAITCLSCHEIHTPNPVSTRRTPTDTTSLSDKAPYTSLYVRADKTHLRTDLLTPVTIMQGDSSALAAIDPASLLCLQCHAPNSSHRAGSSDDRTPLGIHAGKSCLDCHSAHSMRTPRMFPLVHTH
ncbi:MAG: hypothetical protein LBJ58_00425 [Tannerellaceae bacterium]|jgi:hypothetical protein|nr:hypothetical protein [Tannerellaceae bacterium]